MLEGVALEAAKALGKPLGVAILAACADFRAARYRVPRRVRPFNCRVESHPRIQEPFKNTLPESDSKAQGPRVRLRKSAAPRFERTWFPQVVWPSSAGRVALR